MRYNGLLTPKRTSQARRPPSGYSSEVTSIKEDRKWSVSSSFSEAFGVVKTLERTVRPSESEDGRSV